MLEDQQPGISTAHCLLVPVALPQIKNELNFCPVNFCQQYDGREYGYGADHSENHNHCKYIANTEGRAFKR